MVLPWFLRGLKAKVARNLLVGFTVVGHHGGENVQPSFGPAREEIQVGVHSLTAVLMIPVAWWARRVGRGLRPFGASPLSAKMRLPFWLSYLDL